MGGGPLGVLPSLQKPLSVTYMEGDPPLGKDPESDILELEDPNMQDLQHADCTVTPQPQPTPHGGQDQLNKHHYDLPEYDEKPSLTELIEDSTPPPNIPLTGSPPTVLTTLEYCSLPPLSLSCK